jgi:hypothetical protein
VRGIPLAPTKIFPRAQRLTDLFSLIRKSDLAAIGHGLELPAFFPRFLFVPRDGGSAMIVWIADQGGLFLRCA